MKLGGIAVSIVAAGLIGLIAGKLSVESMARSKADAILASVRPGNPPLQLGMELTRRVHTDFASGGEKSTLVKALYALRPYWTNEMLPSPLRPHSGAIDLLYANGLCDTHARALNFVLEEAGFTAWQFNMIAKSGGHSISLAQGRDGKQYLFDALYALAAAKDGVALAPEELRTQAAAGNRAKDLWVPVGNMAVPTFYEGFADIVYAKQGEPLVISETVDLPKGGRLMLGRDDNQADVQADTVKIGWHPFWDYMDSRYDRSWQRTLHFKQDTKVAIKPVGDVNSRFITSNLKPTVEGGILTYQVKANETLVFQDGLAGRDWTRLKSYQDIDYWKFESME